MAANFNNNYNNRNEEKRQAMLNTLLEHIQNNPGEWQQGWVGLDVPYNAASGKNYRGLNALYLSVISKKKGYTDKRWVTFNQACDLEASVKKGEKGTEISYFSLYDKLTKKPFTKKSLTDMTEDEIKEYLKNNVRAVLKFYYVFNAEQCENFPVEEKNRSMSEEELAVQNEKIEKIISNSEAKIYYDGGNEAYYRPSSDTIHLPEVEAFKTKNNYYATALHEIAHSTGHEKRLNRFLTGGFGSEEYAIEELRAELSSVFMQTDLGISLSGAEIANHGAYLAAWLDRIKEDPNVFYKAAADASKITKYIEDHYLNAAVKTDVLEDDVAASVKEAAVVKTVSFADFMKGGEKSADYYETNNGGTSIKIDGFTEALLDWAENSATNVNDNVNE